MKITWLGHSSFLLEDSKGRKILTDPFDNTVGYTVANTKADVVTISHHHFDHDYTKMLEGSPKIIDKIGFFYECDIPITGIPSYHDEMKGAKRGENTIFKYDLDGFILCHLGDLGHMLSGDEIKNLGKINVLFIPIGGNYTIDGKTAAELAKKINSNIVIPMHYKTSALKFPLDGIETFLTHMKNGEKLSSNSIELPRELIETNCVKILSF